MRLRTLNLIKYGGYSDRLLDFGEGSPDLHLIVGPNEAGKSTLLSAIADLLFGFPGQSTQDWKFDYRELRVQGVVERGGASLDVTRRKGNKNTLLNAEGTALADDALTPFVGGYDRATFERMFGLDHAKLRAGGQAILDGRDDAARTLFQAGSGLSAVSQQLKALESEAAALFKPSASVPIVNVLLRQKQEHQKQVREATLGEGALADLRQRHDGAASRREVLIQEAESLERRAHVVERVQRTRGPLARLAAAERELDTIGPTPTFPPDAQAQLAKARTERSTASALSDQHGEDHETASAVLEAIVPDARLLPERVRIEALDEHRPAIEKSQSDRGRREIELDSLNLRLGAARSSAGLDEAAAQPSEGWLRRAARHLEAERAYSTRLAKLVEDEREVERDQNALVEKLAGGTAVPDLAELRSAVAGVPKDAEEQLRTALLAASKARERADTGRAALPWPGSSTALAQAVLPSSGVVADIVKRLDQAEADRRDALKDEETAAKEINGQEARLQQVTAGELLPTPDAVQAARSTRDQALEDVRGRLVQPRREGDRQAGDILAEEVGRVDSFVDRRDADAARLAQHVVATAAIAEASANRSLAVRAIERALDDKASALAAWSAALGDLPATLLPGGFEAWRKDRERVLKDYAEASSAADMHEALRDRLNRVHDRVGEALVAAGEQSRDGMSARLRAAEALLARLGDAIRARDVLTARQETLVARFATLQRERLSVDAQRATLDQEGRSISGEGQIPNGSGALQAAVDALSAAAADVVTRAGLLRQIDGMGKDIRLFEEDTAKLLLALERPATSQAAVAVRGLAHELRVALEAQQARKRAQEEVQRLAITKRTADRRLEEAQSQIDALMATAGAQTDSDLDAVIVRANTALAAAARRAESLRDLDDLGDGRTLVDLRAESEALSPDEAAGQRSLLSERRSEIATERESLGKSLAEAQAALDLTGTEAVAAEAQQNVAEIQAQLASASERFVATATSAALLRWLIERHRASTQAPLLARAGALFRSVTAGAYPQLLIDYGDDDRARIVAVRADGRKVSVEGLSEGTRDQLYLALRLAALQERGAGATLPLICDDLLVTADDGRAALMLKVLQEAAKTAQILVFTHHPHLTEVARRTLGDDAFRLHALTPVGFEAAA